MRWGRIQILIPLQTPSTKSNPNRLAENYCKREGGKRAPRPERVAVGTEAIAVAPEDLAKDGKKRKVTPKDLGPGGKPPVCNVIQTFCTLSTSGWVAGFRF